MEQMNKKELIEYFIELLGNNEFLGKVMSIKQIREKLNNIVDGVTYKVEPGNFAGGCSIDKNGKVIINFDPIKISYREEDVIIVHELLHALSIRSMSVKNYPGYQEIKEENCGIHLTESRYFSDGNKMESNRNYAINEGMTDALAERITGNLHDGYNTAKDIYAIVAIIVGEDNMLKKYFSEHVYEKELDIFEEDMIEKYGINLGNKINDDLKKVFSLSDQLLDLDRIDFMQGLNIKGKELQSKTKYEIYATLEKIINMLIEHEPDAMMRIQDILEPAFKTSLREQVSNRILGDLIRNNEFSFETKLAFLEYVSQAKNSIIPKNIVDNMLFELDDSNNLSAEDKLRYFLKFDKTRNSSESSERPYDKLYDLYVQCGKISEDKFSKRDIFKNHVDIWSNEDRILLQMNNIKYRQIGEYYELGRDSFESVCPVYDSQGKYIKSEYINYRRLDDEKLDILFFDGNSVEKANELHKKIDKIFENIKTNCKTDEEYTSNIVVSANMLKLLYQPINRLSEGEKYCEYYVVDENGMLLQLEPRKRKKDY